MRRLFFIFLLLFSVKGFSQNVSLETAKLVAVNWYRHYAPVDKQQGNISKTAEYRYRDATNFYIFSFDKGGFVMVSANNQAEPVIGYGFEGGIPEKIESPEVKYWFDGYARQIDTLNYSQLKSAKINPKWETLLKNQFLKSMGKTVGPLLTTKWDQGCYFNEMCPADQAGPCGHAWAGCTAVAMAQILKYWNYPTKGIGYKSYVPKYNSQYGQQPVFFNTTYYDWNNMPDQVTSSNKAVATLLYHCGVSAEMDYSTNASGAHLYKAAYGLLSNFDYSDSLKQIYVDSLSKIEIVRNLDTKRPVLMSGFNKSGSLGHAFVCDGYQSDSYFHFNWGWSGNSNGYYTTDNLTPGWFNFNYSQSALINIFPNVTSLKADFYTLKGNIPLTFNFIENSKGNPNSFQWDFGDSSFSQLQNPTHSYSRFGTYIATLIVSYNTYKDTIKKEIIVIDDPFIPTNVILAGNDSKILAIDYNKDGFQDIVITGYLKSHLYENKNGRINSIDQGIPLQSLSPVNLHPADIDNDGNPDLLLNGTNPFNGTYYYLTYLKNNKLGFSLDTLKNIPIKNGYPFSFADYNNDGKADLLLGKELFKNLGGNKFSSQGFIGTDNAFSAWEDVDLDGDLDVAIGSKIFINNGDETFIDSGFNFENNNKGNWGNNNFEWGDYDQDGKPDLLAGGSIIKNMGNHTFQQFYPISKVGDNNYSIWGDIDNDGDLDIININSEVSYGCYYYSTDIFLNNNGSFEIAKSDLQSILYGSINWIDYDHDNKLDLLLTGYYTNEPTGEGNNWTSKLYKNNCARNNNPPSIPISLKSAVNGNNVQFTWNPSTDENTYSGSLTYNLRIGTTANGDEILSSLSDPETGTRYINSRGNVCSSTSWKNKNLVNGKYYWTVQAIDNSYATSAFAKIDSFIINGSNLPPELSQVTQNVSLNTPSKILLSTLNEVYFDPEKDPLKAIRIDSLPKSGAFLYNGIKVVPNQSISITNLDNLVYLSNSLNEDYMYIRPNDGNSWGQNSARLTLKVSLFENKQNLISNVESLFAWGDYDNDGDLDLASTTKIFKNNDGIFQDLGISLSGIGGVIWGDIDNDGKLDLLIGQNIYKNHGNDIFSLMQTLSPVLSEGMTSLGECFSKNTLDYFYGGVDEVTGNFYSKIFANSGTGVFMDSNINIIGFRLGAVAWGDFDNDGDQDLAISGIFNQNNERKTIIFRNDNGKFFDIGAILPGVNVGTLDWADFDRDGDLDLLECGSQGTIYDGTTEIFRNDQGTFTEFKANLPGVFRGFAKWIDVDSDGFLDVILGGILDGNLNKGIKLYKNEKGTSFTEIATTGLPNLAYASCSVGDFNNDGFSDLIISGINEKNEIINTIYRNCFGKSTFVKNTKPVFPTDLISTYSSDNLILKWDKSYSGTKPQNSFTYNIRVSGNPDSLFTVAPSADLKTGFRKIVQGGNTSVNNQWLLGNLPKGTYYWSVQAIDNSFAASAFAPVRTFIIADLPDIASLITGLKTVCPGQNSVVYVVPTIANAASYLWTLPTGATGTSTTNSIIVNYGSSAVSGNITVKGHNDCGDGAASSLAITVNPLPSVAGTITGTTTICQGQNSVTYSVPAITNATSYLWTLPAGATGISTTNSIIVNYSSSAVSGNITVKGHNDCGDGAASTLAVTVNPLVAGAGTITGTTVVCQGKNSVIYSVPTITNATSYVWTLPTGATGISTTNSIIVNYGSSAVSGNITVKGHNDCGDGAASTLSVTVNPLPYGAGTITGSATVCQGQNSVTYSVPAITNATSYLWTLPTGATGTSTTNSIIVNYSSSAVPGNITVKGHNDCGDGAESTLAIIVNPLPSVAGTISGTATVCQGQNSVVYTVPVIVNATSYIWNLPTGATGTSATNSIIVNYGSSAVSGTISVKGHNDCGDGAATTLAISVNPLVAGAGAITGTTVVCQGQNSVSYSVPAINNATSYLWTLPAGSSGTSTTNSIIVNYGATAVSGNISVKGHNDCGDGAASSLAVTVNPKPSTPVVTINGTVLHSNVSTGNQWYNRNVAIGGATGSDYTFTQVGDYTVIVTSNGCASDPSTTNVVTGIDPVGISPSIKVYPNPVTNELIIEAEGNNEKTDFVIVNASGQLIYTGYLFEKVAVQTTGFAPGLYLIKLKSGKTIGFKKIVKL